jgi:hypothetical protein
MGAPVLGVTPEFAETGKAFAAPTGTAVDHDIGRAGQEVVLGPGLGLEPRDDLHSKQVLNRGIFPCKYRYLSALEGGPIFDPPGPGWGTA